MRTLGREHQTHPSGTLWPWLIFKPLSFEFESPLSLEECAAHLINVHSVGTRTSRDTMPNKVSMERVDETTYAFKVHKFATSMSANVAAGYLRGQPGQPTLVEGTATVRYGLIVMFALIFAAVMVITVLAASRGNLIIAAKLFALIMGCVAACFPYLLWKRNQFLDWMAEIVFAGGATAKHRTTLTARVLAPFRPVQFIFDTPLSLQDCSSRLESLNNIPIRILHGEQREIIIVQVKSLGTTRCQFTVEAKIEDYTTVIGQRRLKSYGLLTTGYMPVKGTIQSIPGSGTVVTGEIRARDHVFYLQTVFLAGIMTMAFLSMVVGLGAAALLALLFVFRESVGNTTRYASYKTLADLVEDSLYFAPTRTSATSDEPKKLS